MDMRKMSGSSVYKPLELIFRSCLISVVKIVTHLRNSFERILYNQVLKPFIENELISSNELGLKTRDSCINQLISITRGIYESFDKGCQVSEVFLNISKAFDKPWDDGFLLKLEQNGVSGNLLSVLPAFLISQKSIWANIEAGIPRGSVQGPLLFLIYINDLSDDPVPNAKLFDDDTTLFSDIKK